MSTEPEQNEPAVTGVSGNSGTYEITSIEHYGEPLREFLPEEIVHDDHLNVRPFSSGNDEIESLAEQIKQQGQLQPIVVYLDTDGQPHIIAGNRRVMAINLINAAIDNEDEKIRVKAVVRPVQDQNEAFRLAWSENKDRENMSDMDIALNIQHIRETMGWTSRSSTKDVAKWMGVSNAYVTTHEKLTMLPAQIQAKVHEGKLSVDAALKAATTPTEHMADVLDKAEAIAKEEAAKKALKGKKSKAGKGGGQVKAKHVQAAKRKVAGAQTKTTARSKSDVVELFESEFDGPMFGYENGAIRKFVQYFLGWLKGEGTDKGVVERFKVITEKADHGTPSKLRDKIEAAGAGSVVDIKKAASKKPAGLRIAKKKAAKKAAPKK